MTVSRSQMMEMLESLVEQAFDEAPPEGIPDELWDQAQDGVPPSQYEMWSALTALTQEVRLQGRAFKGLEETLSPVKDGLLGYPQAVELARDTAEKAWAVSQQQLREARREGEEKARQDLLSDLIDVHDRLALSLRSAGSARQAIGTTRPWWLGGRQQLAAAQDIVDSVLEGCGLSLESLGASMQRHQLSLMASQGQVFDPQSMSVVAVELTEQTPEGTVLEVLRPGYLYKGNVFRSAQVKVARQPSRSQGEQTT